MGYLASDGVGETTWRRRPWIAASQPCNLTASQPLQRPDGRGDAADAEVDEDSSPVVSEIGDDVYGMLLVEGLTKVALVVLLTASTGERTWTEAERRLRHGVGGATKNTYMTNNMSWSLRMMMGAHWYKESKSGSTFPTYRSDELASLKFRCSFGINFNDLLACLI